jgi:hypothetical protein
MKAGPEVVSPSPSTLYSATIGETNANATESAENMVNSLFITVGAVVMETPLVRDTATECDDHRRLRRERRAAR